ncbi:unnamed protein product [Alopecurus aequalis]
MELSDSSIRKLFKREDGSEWITHSNHDLKFFTEIEMKRITSNYGTMLGRGGFGEVYKGVLEDGSMVAVKRLIHNVKGSFSKELVVHRKINHKNVVRLIGYCLDENALTMVTEYIPKGTLSDALHKDNIPFSLDTRLRIAIECAEALGYMHSQMHTRIIHGDVKPDNILLDDGLGAKLSDFGISRLVSTESALYTENVVGSLGYMDPLFAQDGRLTAMSDVYSFGVVLLELITRKKARTDDGEIRLVKSFTTALAEGVRMVREMFDAEIATSVDMKTVEEIAKLAGKCLMLDLNKRPEMLQVAECLGKLRKVPHEGQESLFSRFWGKQKQQTCADDSCLAAEPSRQSSSSCNGSFSSEAPALSSDLEDVLDASAEVLGKGTVGPTYRRKSLTHRLKFWAKQQSSADDSCLVAPTSRQSITNWNGSTISFSSAAPAESSDLEDVLDASAEVLGIGTTGPTYRVVLDDGSVIAVKRLQGVDLPRAEFEQWMTAIGAIECRNILPLLGYHFTDQDKFVSYSCMPMGSLARSLHGDGASRPEPMYWDQRLCILSDVVNAVESIHSVGPLSSHGNIKSSNVLLQDSHAACVSEHGLGTLRPFSRASGYRAPEVTDHRHVSQKADVYSFGILMLELFTRKAPVNEARPEEGVDLLRLVSSVAREKWVTQVLDAELRRCDEETELIILQLLQLAIDCCSHNANVRPSMSDVRQLLHYFLEKTMLSIAGL